jgi:hypothetical protein
MSRVGSDTSHEYRRVYGWTPGSGPLQGALAGVFRIFGKPISVGAPVLGRQSS